MLEGVTAALPGDAWPAVAVLRLTRYVRQIALPFVPDVRLALLYGPAAFDPPRGTTDLCAFASSSMPSFGRRGVG